LCEIQGFKGPCELEKFREEGIGNGLAPYFSNIYDTKKETFIKEIIINLQLNSAK
jgi:hypothetical protein